MRIGILTKMEPRTIDFLSRHRFGSIELLAMPSHPYGRHDVSDRQIDELKQQLHEGNIEISAVGSYDNHLDPAGRDQAHEHFLHVMRLAQKLGAGVVSTFAGREPEKSVVENIPAFKSYWSETARRAEDPGLKIAFENCPMFHAHPFRGTNTAFTPKAWEMMFDAVPSPALGLEWDPSHLICLLIDPLTTLRKFGAKILHVHAKDAELRWHVVRENGIFDPDATRHRMPGLGQVNWREVISALVECGYRGNLDIEGEHDPIYHGELEEAGPLIAKRTLEQYLPPPENDKSAAGPEIRVPRQRDV